VKAYKGRGVKLHRSYLDARYIRKLNSNARSLYPLERTPVLIEWNLFGPQGRSGRFGEDTNLQSLPGYESLIFSRCRGWFRHLKSVVNAGYSPVMNSLRVGTWNSICIRSVNFKVIPRVGIKIVIFRIINSALKRKCSCPISRVTRKPNVEVVLNEPLKAGYKQAYKEFRLSLVHNNGRRHMDCEGCGAEGHICLSACYYI